MLGAFLVCLKGGTALYLKVNKARLKYPANCKKCQYADLTATGEQAYCRKKGIFKKVKYFSCKMFEPGAGHHRPH